MKKYIAIFSMLAALSISTAWHKFYLSVTQLDYLPEKQSVQMITRIFYDDLEKTLQDRYDSSIRVEKSYDQNKLDSYIAKYIQQKLLITIDGKQKKLSYLGHKDENDYVVCFIEISNVADFNTLEIENTLLMDSFPDQKNVVHMQVGKMRKSFMLTAAKDSAV
ncbi:MAG: DUF6702 family protein, partial [Leeuwenhoekiella sp.]